MPISKARLRIDQYNENRKARLRVQERRIHIVSLSLTSMVDMFAILVIFLLTNSSTVSQWIEVSHVSNLPKSKYSEEPEKAATLEITKAAVFAEQKTLLEVSRINAAEAPLATIKDWLSKQKDKGHLNIVADQDLPFGVIRKIVATCQGSGFKHINLAVQPK